MGCLMIIMVTLIVLWGIEPILAHCRVSALTNQPPCPVLFFLLYCIDEQCGFSAWAWKRSFFENAVFTLSDSPVIVVFGGRSSDRRFLDDCWMVNCATWQWEEVLTTVLPSYDIFTLITFPWYLHIDYLHLISLCRLPSFDIFLLIIFTRYLHMDDLPFINCMDYLHFLKPSAEYHLSHELCVMSEGLCAFVPDTWNWWTSMCQTHTYVRSMEVRSSRNLWSWPRADCSWLGTSAQCDNTCMA